MQQLLITVSWSGILVDLCSENQLNWYSFNLSVYYTVIITMSRNCNGLVSSLGLQHSTTWKIVCFFFLSRRLAMPSCKRIYLILKNTWLAGYQNVSDELSLHLYFTSLARIVNNFFISRKRTLGPRGVRLTGSSGEGLETWDARPSDGLFPYPIKAIYQCVLVPYVTVSSWGEGASKTEDTLCTSALVTEKEAACQRQMKTINYLVICLRGLTFLTLCVYLI